MPAPAPSLRVLVVDDDPVLIDLLPSLLSVLGHTVDTACTGELALQRLAAPPPPDLILIDLRMPGMDGATLAAAIAALPNPPRLIGMSGSEPTPAQSTHFDAFLRKPFGIHSLDRILTGSNLRSISQTSTSPADPAVLNKAIYQHFAASLPHAQLQQLYRRTLDHIRQTAPAFDTASQVLRSELAHTLHGSCAMVGAEELAALAQGLDHAPPSPLDVSRGSSLESSITYKMLRASDRLERILIELNLFH